MRKKKFRKITDKNIASIYSKINKTLMTWVNKAQKYPNDYNITVEYKKPIFGRNFKAVDKLVELNVWFRNGQRTKNIEIDLRHDSVMVKNNCLKTILKAGDKIFLTGSDIVIKHNGVYYNIRIVRMYRLPMLPDDFDGDILNVYSCKDGKFVNPQDFIVSNDIVNDNWSLDPSIPMLPKLNCSSLYGEFGNHETDNITEDDLPPLEDLLNNVGELEEMIGSDTREMQFKIPKGWNKPKDNRTIVD